MRKMLAMLVALGPLSLAGCADETVFVQPPAQQGSAVVVPERDDPDTVIVPEREPTVIVPQERDSGTVVVPD